MKGNPVLAPVYERAKTVYRRRSDRGRSWLDLLSTFPLYRPYSGGSYRMRAPLIIQSINDIVPSMLAFAKAQGHDGVDTVTDTDFAAELGVGDAEELARVLNAQGSDKATTHGYFKVYAAILSALGREAPLAVFEIGLGTDRTDVVSNMGISGRPGASLRAFRDFLPNARVYGADIDRRILFSEDRIETHFVDQTDRDSFVDLGRALPETLDLMIDDGLHSPNANINSLAFFLDRLAPGGFAVIEDVSHHAFDLWQLMTWMLPPGYRSWIVQSGPSLMFVVRKPPAA